MQEVCPFGQLLLICRQLAAEVTSVFSPSCEQHGGAKAQTPQFSIQKRGRVSDARPRPGLQGKGGGIISFNDGGLGGMEKQWQIWRERISSRKAKGAQEKTGMAEIKRKDEI
ncbi:hypothetical protein TURU_103083 [Turdus rufiventris]|nr:hypothetical protein TURU_103083 [Turdus rufiventris]